MDIAAALTAIFILKPLIRRHHAQNGVILDGSGKQILQGRALA
jgi:hypothetical protein